MRYPVRLFILCLFLIQSVILPVKAAKDLPLKDKYTMGPSKGEVADYSSSQKYPYYGDVAKEYEQKGYGPAKAAPVEIDITKAKVPSGNTLKVEKELYGRKAPAVVWEDTLSSMEWEFTIATEGLYEVEVQYYIDSGSGNPAVRHMVVDGAVPFSEATSIVFQRMWKDEGEPVINTLGDETRPGQIEVKKWRSILLTDSQGFYLKPFSFYFKPGTHSIKLEYVDQPMAIGGVTIKPSGEIPTYSQKLKEYAAKGYKEATEVMDFQAESCAVEKSDPTIRRESNGDPLCQPVSGTSRKLNVLGGSRWKKGNQSVAWEFSVPSDGLYKMGVRVAQFWNDGLPSYRQIAVDGKVPFKELEAYKFTYSLKWQTEVISDSKTKEPYLIYLSKGTHTLTMTAKMGEMTPVIQSLNEDAVLLSVITRDIVKLTGANPDPNYDYEFFKHIPNLKSNMEALMSSLQKKYDQMNSVSDKLPAMANNFMTIKSQLESMVKDPFSIAARMNELNSAQTSLGSWYLSLQSQPLLMDYIRVGTPKAVWKNEQSGIFAKIKATLSNFLVSFKKDYDNVGGTLTDTSQVKSKINVWVARGTEWAELIKEMADEEFTPKTGIQVNINVLPSSQLHAGNVNALMLSITSGRAPDVAVGVDSSSPVEFAIRDADYDLSSFRDFQEVAGRFIPNIFTPYKYRGGVYALPETMDFSVMFYRKDIVEDLKIQLPRTREELYSHVLPVLYQNGLQFFYPADFTQFLFQNGADYYTPDGKRTGLDTPEAYQSFKECSELYTNYGVPVSANFFNRMRSGEMPMGIGGYNMYMQLSVAAPELTGLWGIAPLPGTRKPDGTIDRSNGGLAGQCSIIMKQTKHPEESWEFLKWWSSTPVQTKFAREIEAMIGAEARWNTANLEAFTNLSWDREHLKVILEQWKWAKEQPMVLGGYFTGRHITNAWNKVVIGNTPLRDALEEAAKDINRELRMKQEEYGVFDSQR